MVNKPAVSLLAGVGDFHEEPCPALWLTRCRTMVARRGASLPVGIPRNVLDHTRDLAISIEEELRELLSVRNPNMIVRRQVPRELGVDLADPSQRLASIEGCIPGHTDDVWDQRIEHEQLIGLGITNEEGGVV